MIVQKKPLLIAVATRWGSFFGGINSFNTDFLKALATSYSEKVDVICLVDEANPGEIQEAGSSSVKLIICPDFLNLNSIDLIKGVIDTWAIAEQLFLSDRHVVWLGHDRITGQKAISGALASSTKSALIHHMSYVDYEAFAESFDSANNKTAEQRKLFLQADYLFAIGPLLKDALDHMLSGENHECRMLIPGLADIQPLDDTPKKFTAFLSGRLSSDTAKIKQGYLGVASFASAQRQAMKLTYPKALCKEPRLILRGVDFEKDKSTSDSEPFKIEQELKRFAQEYGDRVINLEVLPFTHDRKALYNQIRSASVALMPSWHEGFGLVGWEAISSAVPLIVTKKSGLFQWLNQGDIGLAALVNGLDIKGQVDAPFFHSEDLNEVTKLISEIADNPEKFKKQAAILRAELNAYTWTDCAQKFINELNWPNTLNAQENSIEDRTSAMTTIDKNPIVFKDNQILTIPEKQWKKNIHTDSQLLRAEEAIVPFDEGRLPDLDSLKHWMDENSNHVAVRLITGAGGTGKTRLALELCYSYQELGWEIGFLSSNSTSSIIQSLKSATAPVLIVIDYAETRQPLFISILKSILTNSESINYPVRILLLAREGGEWWERLLSIDALCEAFLNSKATTGPQSLGNLHLHYSERERAFKNAQRSFASKLELEPTKTIPPLNGDHLGRPLYLHMAALMALYGERPENAATLTDSLLNHESRYWEALLNLTPNLQSLPNHIPQRLVALATLCDGFKTENEAFIFWKKASVNDASMMDPMIFSALYNALSSLHLGHTGMQPMRPDLLGEAQVVRYLLRSDSDALLNAVLDINSSQKHKRHCLTVLARISHHRSAVYDALVQAITRNFSYILKDAVEVAIETQGNLGDLLVESFNITQEPFKGRIAGILDLMVQNQSLQLAKLDHAVCKYLVEKKVRKNDSKKTSVQDKADLGRLYVNLSRAENVIGLSESALESSTKSVKIFTELRSQHPNKFEDLYARSFSSHSNRLANFERFEESARFSETALKVYKNLFIKDKKNYELKYADSLANHSIWIDAIGASKEAYTYCEEALKIYKNLATNNDKYLKDYANGSLNMANRLESNGRYSEALEYCKQAVEIEKNLVEINQDRFESTYAISLVNLSYFTSLSGDYKNALTLIIAAINLFQKFVSKLPDKYSYSLARCLLSLEILNWINDVISPIAVPINTPSPILEHELREFDFFRFFIIALKSNDIAEKEENFSAMINISKNFSQTLMNKHIMYWLIANIWLKKYCVTKEDFSPWSEQWQKFLMIRNGAIPKLMDTIGQRLEIEWPDIKKNLSGT